MPPRRLPAHHYPYTQLLSALRKNDLIRLCVEFGLPVDGSVVNLRNRLKDYLNLHRDTLYRNPRFNALYARHRKPGHSAHQLNPPSTLSSPSCTPSPSTRSHSPADSDDSWHGIGGSATQHNTRVPDETHPPRRNRSPFPQNSPPQSRSPSVVGQTGVFPAHQTADGREYTFSFVPSF
jgi:hypothetical protein